MSEFYNWLLTLEEAGVLEPHLQCPHCNTGLLVKWDTEYGASINGDQKVKCPLCDGKFELVATVTTKYSTYKNE